MDMIEKLSQDERITVRRSGAPDAEGKCVVYWMQRAQRGNDNPALDVAINAANELKKPVVVFLRPCRSIRDRPCGTTVFWRRGFQTL
jgi:deoxyribodipyrimidine photolyase